MSWQIYIDGYESYILLERGLSSNSVACYLNDLKKLASWADYAASLKKRHQTNKEYFQRLENWYIALKLLVVTWEEEETLTLEWLSASNSLFATSDSDRTTSRLLPQTLLQKLSTVQDMAIKSRKSSKLSCLEHQLLEKKRRYGDRFRCIIFVQQRVSAYIVSNFINDMQSLQQVGLRSTFVTGCGAITPSIKVTNSQAKANLQKFRTGQISILVATATAEEVRLFCL